MKIKIRLSTIKRIWMICITTVVMFAGVLVAYNSMNLSERIENKMLLILLYGFIIFIFFRTKNPCRYNKIDKMFIVVCFLWMFTSVFRADTIFVGVSITGVIAFIFLHKVFSNIDKTMYMCVAESMLLACILTIYRYSVSSFNSQGVIIAFGGVMLMNVLCMKNKDNILLFGISVVAEVILLSLTRSRTSMMSFLIVAVLSYAYLFMKKLNIKNLMIMILGVVLLVAMSNYLESFFIKVFFQKWGNADMTSNRMNIWRFVFANTSLLGHGVNHMSGGDAHNTFVQILGCSGIVTFVIFICMMALIFAKIRMVKPKIIYINFFVCWSVISMFENLDPFTSRMIPVSILFFVHLIMLAGEKMVVRKRSE